MKQYFGSNLKNDLPAGLVVALVALPLCLGIALASGAPLFGGLIAGIVGGLVVGLFSGSQLSVSGPAAGLTVIVLNAIDTLGTYESFLLAVFLAGLIQFTLGMLQAGIIGHFFPSSVIKGMLSAIGLILILKQIPHALGDDQDYEGDESFYQPDGENTFTEIILAIQNIDMGALIISGIALGILIMWERPFMKKQKWTSIVPGALVAVVWGMAANSILFPKMLPNLVLSAKHMVALPVAGSVSEFVDFLTAPDFSQFANPDIYVVAVTIAIIASLETLLSLDAVDKLDPYKRIAPTNTELKAQGIGNMVSGLLGGLPLTAVIVRSTANVSSGGKTKVSAIFHGFLLIMSVMFFPDVLNLIPLSALAAVLLVVGYKLAKPSIFKGLYAKGTSQFIPYVITIVAILFTDLLIGITIGIIVGLFYVLKTNLHKAITLKEVGEQEYIIRLEKDVSFLNKAFLRRTLRQIPDESHVVFDETESIFIDEDILETIEDFKHTAKNKNITMEIKQPRGSNNPKLANV
ncbi:SulP family inorganic anion transporter [Marinoscillum furvescens]|uniref:MFS superfamily sulfate permease-like transporter n=1 Tax=Marinoscillum furvescens DSM 4134 TaxID=1122208 RepID=A0A3D9KZD5_MARFU|nr:SulP family inorganic anion transporter [Marinoscillum furvescens]RED95659.1 MFS superfamily sulfate permease-like transporter [Marinoscillum furvescens DSM 4134]